MTDRHAMLLYPTLAKEERRCTSEVLHVEEKAIELITKNAGSAIIQAYGGKKLSSLIGSMHSHSMLMYSEQNGPSDQKIHKYSLQLLNYSLNIFVYRF